MEREQAKLSTICNGETLEQNVMQWLLLCTEKHTPQTALCNSKIFGLGTLQPCTVTFKDWLMECMEVQYVLHYMWMVHPNQADGLQGSPNVSWSILAVQALEMGSGWKQNKQN